MIQQRVQPSPSMATLFTRTKLENTREWAKGSREDRKAFAIHAHVWDKLQFIKCKYSKVRHSSTEQLLEPRTVNPLLSVHIVAVFLPGRLLYEELFIRLHNILYARLHVYISRSFLYYNNYLSGILVEH